MYIFNRQIWCLLITFPETILSTSFYLVTISNFKSKKVNSFQKCNFIPKVTVFIILLLYNKKILISQN